MRVCVCVGVCVSVYVYRAVLTVGVHLIDHVLQLCLSGVLPQRAHDCAQFFGGDGAVPILIKQGERLLEL